MLLSVPNKLLLFETRKDAILSALPHARPFKQWLCVPHKIDETMVLRNLGIPAPSPIETQYDWPGRYKPMAHQIVTAAFLTLHRRAFVLNDIGSGKSLAAYWAADFLMRLGLVRRVLVASPLSTLDPVHGTALYQHFPHRSFTVLHGTANKRRELARAKFDFYIINHEGIEVIRDTLFAKKDIDLILIDELAYFRNGGTNKWNALNSIIRPEQWVWGMTGGPVPNEPTDAYAQARLLKGQGTRYPSFRSFQMATMIKVSHFRWVPKSDAMDRVYEVLQPAVRFSRDECLDLPECVHETRDVPLTPPQNKAYKEMMTSLVTQVNEGKVTALNEAVKIMRLMQVISGVAYDEQGRHQQIDCKPRLAVLKEIIEETAQKVIVFVPFHGNLDLLMTELGKHWQCAQVYGGTPVKERNDIFYRFQNDDKLRILIAHPACMSHGLTLTAASTIVWWAPINSNDTYNQANGRIERKGQVNKMTIIHLASTVVERKVYKRLAERQRLQGILLSMVEDAREIT